jgi:hypothetical protein
MTIKHITTTCSSSQEHSTETKIRKNFVFSADYALHGLGLAGPFFGGGRYGFGSSRFASGFFNLLGFNSPPLGAVKKGAEMI